MKHGLFTGVLPTRCTLSILTIFLLLAPSYANAQSPDTLLARAARYADLGNTDSARSNYQLAVAASSPAKQLRAYAGLIELAANLARHQVADSLITLADPLLGAEDVPTGVARPYRRVRAAARSLDGRYRPALDDLLLLATSTEEQEDPEERLLTFKELALTYNRMFMPDSAVYFIERAYDLARSVYDTTGLPYAYLQNDLTVVYIRAEQPGAAEAAARRGLRLLRSNGRDTTEYAANAYDNLANALDNQERYVEALDYRRRALALYERLGLAENHAVSLYNLGIARYAVGDFGAAAQYVDRALSIREGLVGPGHPSLINSYHAQSVLQSLAGEHAAAVAAFHRLLQLTEKQVGRGGNQRARFLDGLGIAHKQLGNLDSAAYYQRAAIAILQQNSVENELVLARTRYNYSSTLDQLGEKTAALEQIELALESFTGSELTNSLEYSLYRAAHADRLARLGRFSRAKDARAAALAIIRSGGEYRLGVEPIGTLELLCEAAFSAYETDPTAQNLAEFRSLEADFTAVVEQTRRQFHDPQAKGVLSRKVEVSRRRHLDFYARAFARTGDSTLLDRLFVLAEYGKSTGLRDRLRTQVPRFTGVPDSVPSRSAAFQESIERLYYAVADGGTDTDSLRDELFRVRQDYDQFSARVATDYPTYYRLTSGSEPLTPADYLALTQVPGKGDHSGPGGEAKKPGISTVVYLRGQGRYYALVVKDRLSLIECGRVAEVDTAINAYRKALSSTLTEDHLAAGHKLYRLLWEPLMLPPGEKVLVVPDAQLSLVSFAALSSHPTEANYLLQAYDVSYAYSLWLYGEQAAATGNESGELVTIAPGFADHAKSPSTTGPSSQPWSLDLAETIGANYTGRTLTGEAATESAVSNAFTTANLLLFATHGRMDAGAPLRSGIELSPENDGARDNLLTLAEIFNDRMVADLSILGLCESGLGETAPGDGMLSLAYAFGYAGCASTYNTLWMVDDQANARLIAYALEQLADGEGRSGALRRAQLRYLEETADPTLRHPYYWAGLVHQGKNGPVALRRRAFHQGWWLAIATLLTVALAYSLRSKPRS